MISDKREIRTDDIFGSDKSYKRIHVKYTLKCPNIRVRELLAAAIQQYR